MTAVEEFWSVEQVAGPFTTVAESERSLMHRASLYPNLEELMPTYHPGKIVLDYGCGPGHDTVLMRKSGARVYYADVSQKALDITKQRLAMHGLNNEGQVFPRKVSDGGTWTIPFAVEHIHCAGVLHHTSHPLYILECFRRSLLPGGECRIMVYDGDNSEHTQSEVPITNWWSNAQVRKMAQDAGFDAQFVGNYECSAPWRPNCYAACYALR